MENNIIRHNDNKQQFEITINGNTAYVEYKLADGLIDFTSTLVPKELEGKGIGARLVQHALEYARANKLKVIPTCPFVNIYIKRHKEYQDLLDE